MADRFTSIHGQSGGAIFAQALATYGMAEADAREETDNDEELGLLADAHIMATRRLILTPARDIADVITKLEIYEREKCRLWADHAPLWAAILVDLKRLHDERRIAR